MNILSSECNNALSSYLTWTLRCTRVIEQENERNKRPNKKQSINLKYKFNLRMRMRTFRQRGAGPSKQIFKLKLTENWDLGEPWWTLSKVLLVLCSADPYSSSLRVTRCRSPPTSSSGCIRLRLFSNCQSSLFAVHGRSTGNANDQGIEGYEQKLAPQVWWNQKPQRCKPDSGAYSHQNKRRPLRESVYPRGPSQERRFLSSWATLAGTGLSGDGHGVG